MPTLRVIDGPRAGEYVTVDDDVTYPIVLPNPGTSYPFTGTYDEAAPTPQTLAKHAVLEMGQGARVSADGCPAAGSGRAD
jgi:hypothetical protein